MNSILSLILSYVLLYKYAMLFAVIFFSAIVVPLPANLIILAAGAFSSQGYLNFFLSVFVVVAANVLGDIVDFFLARRYGEALIKKLRMDRSSFFVQLQREVHRDAAPLIFMSRFASSLGPVVSVLSGTSRVPFRTFALFDFLGNGVEIGGVMILGFLFGSYWQNFSDMVNIGIAIIMVAFLSFVFWRISRRLV